MLLDYIGWTEAAQLITSAIEKTFKADIFTADLAFGKQAYSTSAFSNQISFNYVIVFCSKMKIND